MGDATLECRLCNRPVSALSPRNLAARGGRAGPACTRSRLPCKPGGLPPDLLVSKVAEQSRAMTGRPPRPCGSLARGKRSSRAPDQPPLERERDLVPKRLQVFASRDAHWLRKAARLPLERTDAHGDPQNSPTSGAANFRSTSRRARSSLLTAIAAATAWHRGLGSAR